jgi:2-keto-4-pentenoate hydratase/2-oxohepta-3-ene-1,7-dioic acid hydratase in catechol pathway
MRIFRYAAPDGRIGLAAGYNDGSYEQLSGDLFDELNPTGRLAEVERILAPVVPAAIIGVGLNYRRHAAETGARIPEYPVIFYKGTNSLQDPGGDIVLPRYLRSDEVDYECELAVVIGRRCRNIQPDEALDYVLGYTCANDVSARDWQIRWGGSQWCRAKSFDTFTPLGPCIVTPESLPDPHQLTIRTILNGNTVQDCSTGDMIFSIPEIISFLSGSSTLLPGTVILTGTPHGVGMAANPPRWLSPGDRVVIEVDGIGHLENRVIEEATDLSNGRWNSPTA